MSDSAHVSLREMGLRAVDGLACPMGGNHDVPMGGLQIIARASGSGIVSCVKCGGDVRLAPLPAS